MDTPKPIFSYKKHWAQRFGQGSGCIGHAGAAGAGSAVALASGAIEVWAGWQTGLRIWKWAGAVLDARCQFLRRQPAIHGSHQSGDGGDDRR